MADSDQPEGKLSISPKLNKRVMDENKTKGNLEELQQPVGRDREVCVCVCLLDPVVVVRTSPLPAASVSLQ